MYAIRTLTPLEFGLYRDHLLRLDADDRRSRFGHVIDDAQVVAFVRSLSPMTTRILANVDDDVRVIGAVQIVWSPGRPAELAFSVEARHAGRGIGTALMERALLWATNRGVAHVHSYCITHNHRMRRLARRAGMKTLIDGGECDGAVPSASPSPLTLVRELIAENAGHFDHARKAGRKAFAALPRIPLAATRIDQPAARQAPLPA